ncbi:KIP1 domain-containing protein [Cephalotus follicularis]|uniref:KIP1 domain-containing protein n=1 Tax=Cephalotus follicularis TaxID=3775 RepID=A0A1Q3CHL9_CEPFO|nr:KIP1 domain-containing protein [Cephalotus follicularis]
MDLDERLKMLLICISEGDNAGDTFAERAEWYYQKRPRLFALLKDLYNGYTTLLDRHRDHDCNHQKEDEDGDTRRQFDEIVAEMVTKKVENDILVDQLGDVEQQCGESWRKIALMKKLLELSESERIILVNDNIKLGYQVGSLLEENKGLASEAMFMKRKAAELARCVLRMRADHRVFLLSQKVEYLQGQIYGLEKRNKEYYNDQLLMKGDQEVKQDRSRSNVKEKNKNGDHEVVLGDCFHFQLKKSNGGVSNDSNRKGICGIKIIPKWWDKVKNMDLFVWP